MMKARKRWVSLLLAVLIAATCSLPALAAGQTQTPSSGSYVRIRYAGNGKYIDVPAEGINDNGCQLQLWEYAYGHQNQVFVLKDTGNGWQIISHQSGKVIEVRDSRHDDYAPVAQWSKHDGANARWDIIKNSDGTVSFRNRESSKFLNVSGGGDASNATKLIQYHDDGTIAMRFYIDQMHYSDVLSATYDRTINASAVKWTQYQPFTSFTYNVSGWQLQKNGKYYHPTVGQKVFVSAEYLSPNTVATLLKKEAYSPSIWNQIEDALAGELSETGVATLLKKLNFGDVPGIGVALGILQVLSSRREQDKWNQFVNAAQIDARGRCSGVIIYTYQTVVDNVLLGNANNGTTALVYKHYINTVPVNVYKTWSGDNFNTVHALPVSGTSGKWYYNFK